MTPARRPARTGATRIKLQILSTVAFNLIVYVLIGLPLAVLPGFAHFQLGYSALLAGFLVSLQYAATLVTRSVVGRLSDSRGPKWAVLAGLGCAAVSGGAILAAGACDSHGWALMWLCASRLWLGAAESGTGTGCITWGIGQTGPAHTAEVMSWNGVASYGGIALGAPAGVALFQVAGLAGLGLVTAGLALTGLALCALKRGTPVIAGARMGFGRVFRRVLPYGACLALGSVGFGTIVAFITLFYAGHRWQGAAYALSAFGVSFVLVRIFLSGTIRRFGGLRAAAVSFAVEAGGLVILWLAPCPAAAMAGASLTGFGLSLIFPAMAVEALKTVELANRGSAIAVYTVFLDLSLGATGPLAGLVIGRFGDASVYLLAAVAAAAGEVLTWRLVGASPR
jgi:predicted MFS family arabinose efflux permease